MSRGRYRETYFAEDYEKIVLKRGIGNPVVEVAKYKPLISIVSFPSKGRRSAISSWMTNSVQHVLSQPEIDTLTILHAPHRGVVEIRTQVALDPRLTEAIALKEKLDHPAFQGRNIIMSTDFLITKKTNDITIQQAISVKKEADLNDKRVLEKIEIERIYWRQVGCEWTLQLDTEIPQTLLANMRLLAERYLEEKLPCSLKTAEMVGAFVLPHLESRMPLVVVCKRCDKQLLLPSGTSLAAFYFLVVRGRILVDLDRPLLPLPALIDEVPTRGGAV